MKTRYTRRVLAALRREQKAADWFTRAAALTRTVRRRARRRQVWRRLLWAIGD